MACWRESKKKWLRDGRSKLADTSPPTTQRAWLQPLIAQALGPRRGDKPQCSLNPSHKGTYLQWNCKFINGIANFWNGYNSRKRRLLRVLFFRTWSTRWHQVTVLKVVLEKMGLDHSLYGGTHIHIWSCVWFVRVRIRYFDTGTICVVRYFCIRVRYYTIKP